MLLLLSSSQEHWRDEIWKIWHLAKYRTWNKCSGFFDMYFFFYIFFYNESVVPAESLFALEAGIFDWSAVLCVVVVCVPKSTSVKLVRLFCHTVNGNLVSMDLIEENCLMGKSSNVRIQVFNLRPCWDANMCSLHSVRHKMFSFFCLLLFIGNWTDK